jgi:polyribonucleotide nucleotidyltransferase
LNFAGYRWSVHISQLAPERLLVSDVLKEGDEVRKVLEIDKQGKIRLSRKEALQETGNGSSGSDPDDGPQK